ncbi:MAG: hypothetical protein E3J72_06485 [Planctomycetota bacterium]|nr:MAG: hypothetical protein E3J72_06485 [Planctomycetota bacterium]
MAEKENDRISRLANLADELERAYQKAGNLLASRIDPVNDAIKKIGVTMEASQETAFSCEEFEAGEHRKYLLCAVRGKNRECGLYVAVWGYPPGSIDLNDKELAIKHIIKPEELPLPTRIKILDVLDDFVEMYERHVRDTRKNLLEGPVVPESNQ